MDARKRILIVEDEADLRAVLRAGLEPAYEVEAFALGDEAVPAIRARLPDLVILDVHLPHRNGLEICEHLRSLPQTARLPVLFLSGRLDAWTLEKAKRAGGDDFLSKPFEMKELVERIEKLTGGA